MADRVDVAPQVLSWALRRSGRTVDELRHRFPRLEEWQAGDSQPTMKQLEGFAQATYTPIGFLFLPAPPAEKLPIPDFRTFGDQPVPNPSADLLDTIYICEQRQDWYRDYAEANRLDSIEMVGSLTVETNPLQAAATLRDLLGFSLAKRVEFPTWTDALGGLSEHAEGIGIMVMVSGIVGSNTHRKLDPEEFRGFALVDDLAPLIFINGADTKAAQIFTLAHELAHVALGQSAVSKPDMREIDVDDDTERWCNQVAAELLVPLSSIRQEFAAGVDLTVTLDRLARFYKVSTLVVLRRAFDAGMIPSAAYRRAYTDELARILALTADRSPGGNFYNTLPVRVSKRFARALIVDTLEGRTSHRDAFRLLGSKKASAFDELGQRLGIA